MTSSGRKMEALRSDYGVGERMFYWLRKNLVYLIMVFACSVVISNIDMSLDEEGQADAFSIASSMIAQAVMAASIKLFVVFLVMKFGLPKLAFQEEIIAEKNVAVGLVFLGIAWIVA